MSDVPAPPAETRPETNSASRPAGEPWPTDDELALLGSERRRWVNRLLPELEARVAPKGWLEVGKRFGLGRERPDPEGPVFRCVRDCVLFDYRAGGRTAVERHIEGAVDRSEKFEQQCFVAALRHRVAFLVPGRKLGAYGFEVQDLLRGETLVLAEPNLPALPAELVYVARILPYPWFWTTSGTVRALPAGVVSEFLKSVAGEFGEGTDWRVNLTSVSADAWASLILNTYVRSLYEEGKAREAASAAEPPR